MCVKGLFITMGVKHRVVAEEGVHWAIVVKVKCCCDGVFRLTEAQHRDGGTASSTTA